MAERLDALGKVGAEDPGQFADGEIEERFFAAGLQMPGVTAAEIGLDHRPPEWPHVVGAGFRAVVVSEHRLSAGKFIGAVEREKQFVGEPSGRPARGLGLARQRRRQLHRFVGDHRCRQRDDRSVGGELALGRVDPDARAAVVDRAHRTIERRRHVRAVRGDRRAVAFGHAPVHVAGVVIFEIVHRQLFAARRR